MLYIVEFCVALLVLAAFALCGVTVLFPAFGGAIFVLAVLALAFWLETRKGAGLFAACYLVPLLLIRLF